MPTTKNKHKNIKANDNNYSKYYGNSFTTQKNSPKDTNRNGNGNENTIVIGQSGHNGRMKRNELN